MAEETVVATPDAGASSAAAPDTSSAAAPVAAAEPTSTTPAVEAPLTRGPEEDERAFLQRVTDTKNKAAEAKAEPVKTEPTKEEPKVEPKVEEPKPEDKKEETEEDDPDAEPFTLEDKAPLPPRALAEKLKADPELAAKLEAAGIKDEVFANARLANKAVAFIEEFPGGVEDAKYAKAQAETFGQFDELITSARFDSTAADKIIGKMMELDYVVDDQGKPVLDPATGQPRLQGNTQAFVSQISDATWDMRLTAITKEAEAALKANPDDETANSLLAAVDILKSRKSGSDPEGEMTPAQKAKQAELDAREAESVRAGEAARVAEHQAREEKIIVQMDTTLNEEVSKLLGKTDLDKERYGFVLDEIRQKIYEKLSNDSMFTSRRDWIMRAQFSPAVEKQRIAHAVNSAMGVALGSKGIVREVLQKYGAKEIAKSQERRAKIDTQIKNSEKDVKGAVGIAAATSPLSGPELRKQAMDAITKEGGDPYDTHALSKMMFKLRSQGA